MMKSFFAKKKVPSAPDGIRIYAIGDIHGRSDLLDLMHDSIVADAAGSNLRKTIVYLGDYVDRGPDSKGVLNRLIYGAPSGFEVHRLRGNHDVAMTMFLQDPNFFRIWKPYGASETLLSYGVKPPMFDNPNQYRTARDELARALPQAHIQLLDKLKMYLVLGDYLFVHAGIRPGVALGDQLEEDFLHIRDEFLNHRGSHNHVVVHGHTPLEKPERKSNRISVDTGAYATGFLTAAVLEGPNCRFLQVSPTKRIVHSPASPG